MPRCELQVLFSAVKSALRFPERRYHKIFLNYQLLGCPLLKDLVCTPAQKRMYLRRVELSLPDCVRSRKYRVAFELYRCFFRSIQFYWKGYQRNFTLKDITDMRPIFMNNPSKYAVYLKDLFQSFRSEVFNKTSPTVNPLRFFFNGDVDTYNKLQSAACSRALPMFDGNTTPFVEDCIKRYTTTPEPYPIDEWKNWIKDWANYYSPYVPVSRFPFVLGTGACLEYSRSRGGITKAAMELMKRPLSKKQSLLFDRDIANVKMITLSRDVTVYRQNYYLIHSCLDVLRVPIEHAKVCTGCDRISSHPPMCILAICERGYKVRLPTMTLAPIVILSKCLRQVADAYLRSDPRISPSLKGEFITELPFTFKGGYRSQDLTVATDHHIPEITREFYKCIDPGLSWWGDAVRVVCNYYTIFDQTYLKAYRRKIEKYSDSYIWDKPLEFFQNIKGFGGYLEKFLPGVTVESDLHWDRLAAKHGQVTRRGQPMGIASSWPLLPLISLFAFEQSSYFKRVQITRKVGVPISNDAFYYYKVLNHKLKTKTVTRTVPVNFNQIRTTGDDAVMIMTKRHSDLHTNKLCEIGSIVSKTKDYFSYDLAIYTEIVYENGSRLPIAPMGPYLAPESTRQCTWYSQPDAIMKLEKDFNFRCNRKLSVFNYIWQYLEDLGCPIFAPRFLGGLNLSIPHKNIRRLSRPVKLLLFEDLKNFHGLDRNLPLDNLDELGKIERPVENKAEDFKEYIKKEFEFDSKADRTRAQAVDLSPRSLDSKSPGLMMTRFTWNAIFKSQFTWDQLTREHLLEEEPLIHEYIHRFNAVPTLTVPHLNQFIEEYKVELEEEIEIPWGLAKTFKPTLCLPLPRADEPRFYFSNKSLDLRTAILEIEGEN